MTKTIKEYRAQIVRALKKANTYSTGLDMQVASLASAMRNLDMANDEIDGLACTTVLERTRYGEKLAPHPVFKIQKDAQDSITRQMKVLGLTTEALAGAADDDPLYKLTEKVISATKKGARVVGKKNADTTE